MSDVILEMIAEMREAMRVAERTCSACGYVKPERRPYTLRSLAAGPAYLTDCDPGDETEAP